MNYGRWNGGTTRCVRLLLISTIALYVLQVLVDHVSYGAFRQAIGLSVGGLLQGHVWQLVTYLFVHGSIMHLLFNMLALYLLGPELERTIGSRNFLLLYLLSGVVGGIGWLLLRYPMEGLCIGASGAIFGVLGAFAALFPQREMVLIPIPIAVKTWILVLCLAGIQLVMLITPGRGGIAYAAHLAGGIGGYLYALSAFRPEAIPSWLTLLRMRGADRRRRKQLAPDRASVDQILDKLAREGIHKLTPAERAILDKASRSMRSP
jgi:membrane associated rhomboid family serine protease